MNEIKRNPIAQLWHEHPAPPDNFKGLLAHTFRRILAQKDVSIELFDKTVQEYVEYEMGIAPKRVKAQTVHIKKLLMAPTLTVYMFNHALRMFDIGEFTLDVKLCFNAYNTGDDYNVTAVYNIGEDSA